MSKILNVAIPIGLGDCLHAKPQLDWAKQFCSEINIAPYEPSFSAHRIDLPEYREFIHNFMKIFFSESPFNIVKFEDQPYRNSSLLYSQEGIYPIRPQLSNYLCKPIENIYGNYIVLSTKIRQLPYSHYQVLKSQYFKILNKYTSKYKIMILGERDIEYNPEYEYYGTSNIYSIYNDLIENLPKESIIDLTVPKLGITTPDLNQLLHDCSLMKNACYGFGLGIGGNFCISVAIGNYVGYRVDEDHVGDLLYTDANVYPDLYVTKNLGNFFTKLEEIYLR